MMSLGVPMIVMGDEVRRTQGGNNNAYCHDNEANWFDWSLVEKHADVHRFVKLLIARRLLRDVTHEQRRTSLTDLITGAAHAWHGVRLYQPDWGEDSHSIAFEVKLRQEEISVYMIFNAYWEPLDFELPSFEDGRNWRRWIDTTLRTPEDIVEWGAAVPTSTPSYRAGPRSLVILVSDAP
jgi:isoamylase